MLFSLGYSKFRFFGNFFTLSIIPFYKNARPQSMMSIYYYTLLPIGNGKSNSSAICKVLSFLETL